MRRRRPLDVWPSYADLMTVLAVIGLFISVGLLRKVPTSPETQAQLVRSLARQNERLRRHLVEVGARHSQDASQLARQAQEVARNQRMFQAIQEAQRQIDEISTHSGLRFSADQSLEFGDDLVTFETNLVEPIWRPGGRSQLRDFCLAMSASLERQRGAGEKGALAVKSMFNIEVEGHTDSTQCPDDPFCNWRISSGRAASFVAVMRQPELCPGGAVWSVRSVGYAETRPPAPGLPPTRRIAVRLIPDYGRIMASFQHPARN